MSVEFEDTFCEENPGDLARSLRLMAVAVPPDGTVTVTLTPVAARLVARSIEAGLAFEKAMDEQPEFEWLDGLRGSGVAVGYLIIAAAAVLPIALFLVLT